MMPDPTIILGTSRLGLCISSDAPLDSSKPTHRNTSTPMTPRKPATEGLRSAADDVCAGCPCLTRNAMNSAVKMPTTAILTNVPMFGPHLPYRNAMIAVPTVTHVNTRPTMISPVVPSGLLTTKALSVAITVADSVPPIQMGLDSQYSTAVIAPAGLPNAILAHS